MELAFPPGVPPARPGPLSRFLPPVEQGAVARFLEIHPLPPGWVLDPFGTSPRLAMEAARARGAVAAFSNPVTRFVLEMRLRPPDPGDLRTAVALLAAAPKDGGRLEKFLLGLYQSECDRCRAAVTVDQFIWDRDLNRPILKAYLCHACHHVGEEPTTAADQERALSSAGYGLAHAMAAERTTPADGQDREPVEAALAVYPARALYALIAVLQKIEQLPLTAAQRRAADALFLSAADAANGLWGYPETRARPKQLIASPRFREVNVWRAIERAGDEWRFEPVDVEMRSWPDSGPPTPGLLSVFPGPIRDLEQTLPGEIPAILTALPRPNQAYWTLSALWASWLWGREAAAPIRIALRRRRYDWSWHAAALRGAFGALVRRQPEGSAAAVLLPEAEHGFIAAALAGMEAAGYRLRGQTLRMADGQAVFTWESSRHRGAVVDEPLEEVVARAAERALRQQGEPAGYGLLHAAATIELARTQRFGGLWAGDLPPLSMVTEAMEAVLAPGGRFVRLEPRVETESGHYWLTDPSAVDEPLSDRVERLVLASLRGGAELRWTDVERQACAELRGLLTPDRRLVQACVESYAEPDAQGRLQLRAEDRASARAADIDDIRVTLAELGRRLGCDVLQEDEILWRPPGGGSLRYRVQESASMGAVLESPPADLIVVLPGGRASLVAEKGRRDPRLRAWLAGGGRIIKFRHVRRLASDRALTLETLDERLGIDPPEHEDPQLPLL